MRKRNFRRWVHVYVSCLHYEVLYVYPLLSIIYIYHPAIYKKILWWPKRKRGIRRERTSTHARTHASKQAKEREKPAHSPTEGTRGGATTGIAKSTSRSETTILVAIARALRRLYWSYPQQGVSRGYVFPTTRHSLIASPFHFSPSISKITNKKENYRFLPTCMTAEMAFLSAQLPRRPPPRSRMCTGASVLAKQPGRRCLPLRNWSI
jgi:hypothetical protein